MFVLCQHRLYVSMYLSRKRYFKNKHDQRLGNKKNLQDLKYVSNTKEEKSIHQKYLHPLWNACIEISRQPCYRPVLDKCVHITRLFHTFCLSYTALSFLLVPCTKLGRHACAAIQCQINLVGWCNALATSVFQYNAIND